MSKALQILTGLLTKFARKQTKLIMNFLQIHCSRLQCICFFDINKHFIKITNKKFTNCIYFLQNMCYNVLQQKDVKSFC